MAERKQVKRVNPKANIKRPHKKPVKKAESSYDRQRAESGRKTVRRSAAEKITMAPKNNPTANKPDEKKESAFSERIKNEPKKTSVKREPTKETKVAPKQPLRKVTSNPKPAEQGERKLNVIKGNKSKNNRKKLIIALCSLIVVASVIIVSALSPTGIIERFSNSFALMGSGEYPITVSGSKVFSVASEGEKTFMLTDSHLSGYNENAKTFLEYQHGFGNPVLEVSAERTLVYNRESTGYIIANNSEKLFEGDVKNPIYCGDIADCGYVAFAGKTEGYAAQVKVYEEDMTEIFSWYLTEGFVSDMILSNNGDYLAVSVLKVKNGVFISEITCFETDNPEPIYTKEFSDRSIRKLEILNSDQFVVLSDKNLMFLGFEGGQLTERAESVFSPTVLKKLDGGLLAVFSENSVARVVVYGEEGEILSNFEYSGLIDDITLYEDTVYILKGNKISVLDSTGKFLAELPLKQVSSHITGHEEGVLVTDNLHISLVNYSKPEE